MDLSHDNLGVSDVTDVAKSLGNIGAGIADAAKKKSAQKVADNGQYWTLRPFLKSMIQIPQYILEQVKNQGITYYAVYQLPAQGVGANNTDIINQLKSLSGQGVAPGVSGPAADPKAQNTIGTLGVNEAVQPMGTTAKNTMTDLKKYIPYALGVLVIGVIIYFIVKHK